MSGVSLPERVAQWYYKFGLLNSSYPITAIFIAVGCVLMCCYSLLNIPLPGNTPTVITLPYLTEDQNNRYFKLHQNTKTINNAANSISLTELLNNTQWLPYIWTKDKPLAYVQQIILKTGVSPWSESLQLWDSFRAPLQEVFRLLDTIRNHEDPDSGTTLTHHCFHVENVKRLSSNLQKSVLPEYSCLVLSPANLWQQNSHSFSQDSNILGTIFNYQNFQKGKVSTAEMLFGMPLKDTGIKRYPLRSRSRVLHYAITLIYQEFNEKYMESLNIKLLSTYPMHQKSENKPYHNYVTLIYYPGKFNCYELVPLSISFIGLFMYIYFSVRKIEFVKAKCGLAICAVITVAGSLSMSVGLCFFFGLTLSLQGKEIFPHLVLLVGLENVLVLTKSVTSTDQRLDVKIRLAQGLSKEGWSITKNLLTEITILTVSLFTFVPVIQEFSIFMIVSLISDFFLQMMFFSTCLGMDMRRMEYYQDKKNNLQLKTYFNPKIGLSSNYHNILNDSVSDSYYMTPHTMSRSKSHPRLDYASIDNRNTTNAVKNENKLPKRIRLVNIWARTRFFQRAFMFWMVVWISMIVYNSGIVEYLIEMNSNSSVIDLQENPLNITQINVNDATQSSNGTHADPTNITDPDLHSPPVMDKQENKIYSSLYDMLLENSINNETTQAISLKYSSSFQPWNRISNFHWSTVLSQYNISTSGRYITVLPPVLLSYRVTPDMAMYSRHPDEKQPQQLRWQALAAALDPLELSDFELGDTPIGLKGHLQPQTWNWGKSTADLPIYPTTPMEILLLAILCAISVLVIAYTLVVLYRCVCSRNYAEWRASWSDDDYFKVNIMGKTQTPSQLVMEAVPLIVAGHLFEVECIATDGQSIVSTCLEGSLKVWEPESGDLVTSINRRGKLFLENIHLPCIDINSIPDALMNLGGPLAFWSNLGQTTENVIMENRITYLEISMD